MRVTWDFIYGLVFGIEHIGRDDTMEIDESALIIEIGFVRIIVWMGDSS